MLFRILWTFEPVRMMVIDESVGVARQHVVLSAVVVGGVVEPVVTTHE